MCVAALHGETEEWPRILERERRRERDARTLAGLRWPRQVAIWDFAGGQTPLRWNASEATVQSFAFSPDGRHLASTSLDQTLRLWHVATWRELGIFWRRSPLNWLAFAGRDPALFIQEQDRGLRVVRGRE